MSFQCFLEVCLLRRSFLLMGKLRQGKKKWFTQCHIVNLQLYIVVLAPVLGANNGPLTCCNANGRVNSNVSAVFTFSFPQAGVQMMCVTCNDIWGHRKKSSLLLDFSFLSLKILKIGSGCSGFRTRRHQFFLLLLLSAPWAETNTFALQHIEELY